MRIASVAFRAALVVWLGVGTQLHATMEQAEHWHHLAEHAHEAAAQDASGAHRIGSNDSHHHTHDVPHNHTSATIAISSKDRSSHGASLAVIPTAPVLNLHLAELNATESSGDSVQTHLTRCAIPRAPPLA